VSLDHADHLLTDPADGRYVASVTTAWAQRYLDGAATSRPDGDNPDIAPGSVEVALAGPSGYTSVVRTHDHTVMADEPTDKGGAGEGPDPYEFLGAALGTCTAMTLRMFADRKDIPLEGAAVTVTHERIHAADCDDCDSDTGFVGLLRRSIVLTGDLDPDQRALLMKIADRCPVHKTLVGEIRIETIGG
jgi:putative redox protein